MLTRLLVKFKYMNDKIRQDRGGSFWKGIATGVGLTALMGAAYHFYGPKGEEHRDVATKKFTKVRKDLQREVANLRELSKEKYDATVDRIVAKYDYLRSEYGPELESLHLEMKDYWRDVTKNLGEIKDRTKEETDRFRDALARRISTQDKEV